jgi:hypothetical protein
MRKLMLAGMSGLLILASQAAVAEDANGPAPGTRAFCHNQWEGMVANHTTGDQTRAGFMHSCLSDARGDAMGGNTIAFLGLGAIAVTVTALALTRSHNPASP